jgi:hypothetical protein
VTFDPDEASTPSAFRGADYGLYGIWPERFYAYTRGDLDVALVTMEWSYADPSTRETFELDPIEGYEVAWYLELADDDTVHDNDNQEDICAVRLDAYAADGSRLDCMTNGGEPSWIDAEACRTWISSD